MGNTEALRVAGWDQFDDDPDREHWRSPSRRVDLLRDQNGGLLCTWRVTGPRSLSLSRARRTTSDAWPCLVRLALRAERLLTRWARLEVLVCGTRAP